MALVICNARAMGEFGAVSVVSGHIRGLTNTMPLYVEILYNDYDFAASFAVASLLTLLALLTLVAKAVLARRSLPSREEPQPKQLRPGWRHEHRRQQHLQALRHVRGAR